jgi:hypothetical protein
MTLLPSSSSSSSASPSRRASAAASSARRGIAPAACELRPGKLRLGNLQPWRAPPRRGRAPASVHWARCAPRLWQRSKMIKEEEEGTSVFSPRAEGRNRWESLVLKKFTRTMSKFEEVTNCVSREIETSNGVSKFQISRVWRTKLRRSVAAEGDPMGIDPLPSSLFTRICSHGYPLTARIIRRPTSMLCPGGALIWLPKGVYNFQPTKTHLIC